MKRRPEGANDRARRRLRNPAPSQHESPDCGLARCRRALVLTRGNARQDTIRPTVLVAFAASVAGSSRSSRQTLGIAAPALCDVIRAPIRRHISVERHKQPPHSSLLALTHRFVPGSGTITTSQRAARVLAQVNSD